MAPSQLGKLFAVVDLGSNTAILSICEVRQPLTIVEEQYRLPQLAKGLNNRLLSGEALARTANVLREFKEICDQKNITDVFCIGTAPFRKISNPKDVVEYFFKKSGIRVTPITGKQEAEYAYQGAFSGFSSSDNKKLAVVDVGGGSSEIIWGSPTQTDNLTSISLGCFDLTNGFLSEQLSDKGTTAENAVDEALAYFTSALKEIDIPHFVGVIGVAGTPTALALVSQEAVTYDPESADCFELKIEDLARVIKVLAATPLEEKIAKYGLPRARAELLLAGGIIFFACLRKVAATYLITRHTGVRHGLAMSKLEELRHAY